MAKEPGNGRTAEYKAFERLTRKLVKVPKHELDAERAKANGKKPKPA